MMEETMESKRQRTEERDTLEVLPGVLWSVIGKHVADYDRVAFGLTCKTFLEAVTMATSPEWKKGAAKRWSWEEYSDHSYDSDLLHLAAFQGSKKVIKWLEKRRKLDKEGISDIVAEANKFYEEDGTHKTSAWSRFFRQIKKAGWDVSKVYNRDQGYRADICDQVDMDE
ncbi:hypothetical protein HOP50_12g66030 [Chloropicon primus]|nr:hypothetical protein HOP50_12g66030 [Chloropicon primus]